MQLNVPVEHVLKTAGLIGRGAIVIAAIGTVASYGTQVSLLVANQFHWFFAAIIPATVDILAICAAMALQLSGLAARDRKLAGAILTTAVIVSVAANVQGAHNTVSAIGHAWPIIAYLLGELLANRVRAYAARLAGAAAAAPATVTVTQMQAAVAAAQTAATANVNAQIAAAVNAARTAMTAQIASAVSAAEAATRAAMATEIADAVAEAERITRQAVAVEAAMTAVNVRPRRVAAAAEVRKTVTADVADAVINPTTGQPYSERHTRRLRNGK